MDEQKQLARRLEEVILNGTWIANTNFKAQIMNVDVIKATKSWMSCNSIALLTFHLNYYIAGILEVFEGKRLAIKDKFSFDLPTLDSEVEWRDLRDDICRNAEKLVKEIGTMPTILLSQDFEDPTYGSYRRNIDGLIEHCYYHLGQVVLLKKMMKSE